MAEAMEEVRAFNEFFHQATEEVKTCYNGLSSIEHYKKCFRCGAPHTEMRLAIDHEVPDGSTIQPILEPEWN